MITALLKKLNENGLEQDSKEYLEKTFAPFFDQAEKIKKDALAIVVTSLEQTKETTLARSMRLELKAIRVKAEKTRVAVNAEGVKRKRAVDSLANMIKGVIVPIEAHLQEQEDFIEKIKAKEREELKQKRIDLLKPFLRKEFNFEIYDLDKMAEAKFQVIFESNRKYHQEQLEKKRQDEELLEKEREKNEKLRKEKEEADRLAQIKLDKERQENEQARKEVEEKLWAEKAKSAKLREKERKENEAKLASEREETIRIQAEANRKLAAETASRKKVEAELQTKKDAEEAKEKADREFRLRKARKLFVEQEKARLAPDREKLKVFTEALVNWLEWPQELSTPEAREVIEEAQNMIDGAISLLNNY